MSTQIFPCLHVPPIWWTGGRELKSRRSDQQNQAFLEFYGPIRSPESGVGSKWRSTQRAGISQRLRGDATNVATSRTNADGAAQFIAGDGRASLDQDQEPGSARSKP